MASPYESVTVNNYNANPPSDDGSETPENRINWSTIKSKLADTLKVAVDDIDDNVLAAFTKMVGAGDVVSTAITYEVSESNQGDLIRATASGITITTPDATVVGSPFSFGLLNDSAGSITFDGNGSQTINGSPSLSVAPGDGYQVYTDGSNWFVTGRKTGVLPRGHIDGCILSNGTDATNDINIAAGVCRDSTNAVDIAVAAMAGKQLDANWAAGAGAGMRNSAVGITDTTYHIYAVAKADGTQDIYAHTSATVATVLTALQAETGGADYIYARRIGSVLRESAAIVAFVQVGDYFERKTLITDIAVTNPGTSADLRAIKVPLGIVVRSDLVVIVQNGSTGGPVYALVTNPAVTADTPSAALTYLPSAIAAAAGVTSAGGAIQIWTDTSARVRSQLNFSDGNVTLRIFTRGWSDQRGKDA